VVESVRTVGEAVTTEQRYYVSSLPADPVVLGTSVRAHWGIENSLHYVLDVAFGEDACRIKSGNGPEDLTFIRKIALSLARSDSQSKRSIAGRIKQMAWSDSPGPPGFWNSFQRDYSVGGLKPPLRKKF
jgi:predicted transposase YbfD/YdcC